MDSPAEISPAYFQQKREKFDLNPGVVVDAFNRCLPQFMKDQRGKVLDLGSAVSGLMGWASTYDAGSGNDRKLLGEYFRRFADISADYSDILSTQKSKETLVDFATFNQRLAQDLFAVTSPTSTKQDQENARLFYQIADAFQLQRGKFGQELTQLLSSARGQAAVMRLLYDKGYGILVPDPEDPDEVEMWDVRGGVDFAAVTPDKKSALFIDMKSQRFNDANQKMTSATVLPNKFIPALHNRITKDIQAYTGIKDAPYVVPLEIQVPTDLEYIDPLGRIVNKKLQESIENQLIDSIYPPYAKAA